LRTSACAISSRCCSPPDQLDDLFDAVCLDPPTPAGVARDRDRDAPAGAVEAEPDEVDPADPGR